METTPRWTEIEHLPAWDEEFYHIYTAKKLGKWVMMKTLRPEYSDKPDKQAMIEKEFDVRYNLAHPNVVMVNDFEDVPGVGRCIIFDDVYGDSLRKLIDTNKLTPAHVEKLRTDLPAALKYIQNNHIVHHPLRAERIIFTENIGNLKMIDVGFDQTAALTPQDTAADIYNFGMILMEAMEAAEVHDPSLRRVAERCLSADPKRRPRTIDSLQMALDHSNPKRFYTAIIVFLLVMVGILTWLSIHPLTK